MRASRGIVAGCGFALYALAAYMRPALEEVAREVPEARVRTYVDDVRMDVIVHHGAAAIMDKAKKAMVQAWAGWGSKRTP